MNLTPTRTLNRLIQSPLRLGAVVTLILTLILSSLALPSAEAAVQNLTLNPAADTHVQASMSTQNFGSYTFLTGSSSDARAMLRWNTAGKVPAGATLTGAILRIYPTNISVTTGGAEVHPQSNSWVENTVTWNTQPSWNTTVLATSATPRVGQWLEISLPLSSISLTGDTSVGIRYTASGSNFRFGSREATTGKPELALTYDTGTTPPPPPPPPPTGSMTYSPSADSYVRSGAPTTNFGTATELASSSTDSRAYLKWATGNTVPSGSTITSLKLRLFTKNISVTSGGFEVHPTSSSWAENTLIWNSQPTWNSQVLGTSPTPLDEQWVEVNLPATALNRTADTALAVRYTVSGSNGRFTSREYANTTQRPQLIVDYTTDSPPPPPTDPVLLAAGDIACRPGMAVTATTCQHGAVSDLVLAQTPTAVAVLGDTQYDNGTLTEFMGSYALTWGRFKNITYPVPGNHEYSDPAGGAKGYFDYWNGAGNATGQAGERGKGYYSYNLGNWHIVVINSECWYAGGCGVGSAQYNWLQQDLANNTAQCTLTYTHHPRFTSHADYDTDTVMGDMWNLMVADVDVMLAGHQHATEIYKKIGATLANSSIPVLNPTGIKQFVVGTGGRSHYNFVQGPTLDSTGGVAMEARDDETFGALKLVLKPTGYDWNMLALPGSNFHNADSQTTGAFTGSETCS